MRFFIALDLPAESRQEIESVQQQLKQLLPHLRLTDPNKLHLTISFIGEQADDLRPGLIKLISKATDNLPPFEITPAYLDGFPNLHYPHTIWLGVKGEVDKIILLTERVRDELFKLNIEVDERRFVPHIAIAKTNDLQIDTHTEAKLQALMQDKQFMPIKVSSVKLFESIPDHDFHRHNTLAEVELI